MTENPAEYQGAIKPQMDIVKRLLSCVILNATRMVGQKNLPLEAAEEITRLRAELAEAETYVRAYKCQCDAPKGIEGASAWLKRNQEQ